MDLKRFAAICPCVLLSFLCLSVPTLLAQSDEPALMRSCEAQISAKFRQWRVAPVSPAVEQFAKGQNTSATRVSADFDGDGRRDTALLIMEGTDSNRENPNRLDLLHIAVCMNRVSGAQLFVIDKPYCGDGISVSRRGARYHDFENEVEGVYKLDGVHAYCLGQAGATYQFESGSFRRIVDDD